MNEVLKIEAGFGVVVGGGGGRRGGGARHLSLTCAVSATLSQPFLFRESDHCFLGGNIFS